MLWPCRYLFYKLYSFASIWGRWWDPTPQITAWILMTLITWWTAFTAFAAVEWRLGRALLPPLSKIGVLTSAALFAVPLYFVFVRRDRFLGIVRQFTNETKRQKLLGAIAVVSYIIALYLTFVYVVIQRGRALGLTV